MSDMDREIANLHQTLSERESEIRALEFEIGDLKSEVYDLYERGYERGYDAGYRAGLSDAG